jgi:hypothetical protein
MQFNLFQTLTSYLITIYFNIIIIQICTYILQILLQQTEVRCNFPGISLHVHNIK